MVLGNFPVKILYNQPPTDSFSHQMTPDLQFSQVMPTFAVISEAEGRFLPIPGYFSVPLGSNLTQKTIQSVPEPGLHFPGTPSSPFEGGGTLPRTHGF